MKHFLLFLSVIFISCSSPKGYTKYQEAFKAFPNVLRGDDAAIKKFCEDIIPDDGTFKFMEAHGMSYRGIPENKKDKPEIINELRSKYEKQIKDFIQDLKDDGTLADFQFEKIVREGTEDISYLPPENSGGRTINRILFSSFNSVSLKYNFYSSV
jgi:hypothetical protein